MSLETAIKVLHAMWIVLLDPILDAAEAAHSKQQHTNSFSRN